MYSNNLAKIYDEMLRLTFKCLSSRLLLLNRDVSCQSIDIREDIHINICRQSVEHSMLFKCLKVSVPKCIISSFARTITI